jgi:hypothetical protein
MDFLAILEFHLRFIEQFHKVAAEPFDATMRKIESAEGPFVPKSAPGDFDGYEYQAEYNDARDCLSVLGNCGLILLEKALHDYVRAFVEREGGPGPKKSRESWFDRHCRFLEENTAFCWANSPVARDRIEQINLSRNDIVHHPVIDLIRPRQSDAHFGKYPASRFVEEWEIQAMSGPEGKPEFPLTIDVTRENVTAAIADVRDFCVYIESQRTKW